jgi:hypothetical protein
LVVGHEAEVPLQVERLPLEAGLVPDQPLHGRIVSEDLGDDVPGAVEPLEELQLVLRERGARSVAARAWLMRTERLLRDSNALAVLLVNGATAVAIEPRSEQADEHEVRLGAQTMASLEQFVAAELARTGWRERSSPRSPGDGLSVDLTHVAADVGIAVVYDGQTSLGLVRIRVRKARARLVELVQRN